MTEPAAPPSGKVAVVTGAAGGMGRVLVTELARRGHTVVAVIRTPADGERLRAEVAARIGVDRLDARAADLADLAAVHELAAGVRSRHPELHLLVNNAGALLRRRAVTAQGVEMHVAVDHLAAFALTDLLLEPLRAGAPARVVNVVSATIADTRRFPVRRRPRPVLLDPFEVADLRRMNPDVRFAPFQAYARAKLLTVMCGYLLAERLRGTGVTVNAVHPGVVATRIAADALPAVLAPLAGALRRFLLTPEQGAAAVLRVATAPELDGVTGRYFVRDAEARSPEVSYDRDIQEWLWAASAAVTGRARGLTP
ncbi:SDR family NAD(P)-dependent oxidoreductase [Pseudonocardia humida]|uniref:SDR family NAD(P)-dependent oxidoreductase n=1 Tax=Pseudonocardia humida TaxID=2800819 RepID=A0ABT0ZSR1_9PSEU|nr:SDR family NAD(P)-dependent oxidoreductase [Pseudonocardia humida]MCO1653771.1 SDR family NAD(P)-dependent oxidoreductase [Pseudonocardia humida]